VGRSYPPEFYSWITVPHVRSLFERMAIETEQDYQNIIRLLKNFGVEVLRPNIPNDVDQCKLPSGRLYRPPMTPRDYTGMFGTKFYENFSGRTIQNFYNNIKDVSWPEFNNNDSFSNLPKHIQQECTIMHGLFDFEHQFELPGCYDHIFKTVQDQGNQIVSNFKSYVSGATVARIGRDLFVGTESYNSNLSEIKAEVSTEFPQYRTHVVNTGGHSDGTYCPVCPGLIISLCDVPTYADTYPDWEVVYLPNKDWSNVEPFSKLKEKNAGKWWIPGFEHDQDVVNTVETWLGHWSGYIEETVFDVNMLIIDPKNVMVFNYNKQVFDALDRHGITPHIVPFRHKYFWDGGIHCVTSDLHRDGVMQDYFPQRG
jgi:hypothetical protein